MKKHSFIFNFSLAAFLVILLLILKLSFSHEASSNQLGYKGLRKLKEVDWLFIGTSHVDCGIDVKLFEKKSGQSAYALWYPGLNTMEMLLYVKNLESENIHYKNIVLDVPTGGFSIEPNIWSVRTFYEAPPALKMEIFSLYLEKYKRISGSDLLKLIFSGYTADTLFFPVSAFFNDQYFYHGMRPKVKPTISPDKWKNLKTDPRFLATKGVPKPYYMKALNEILIYLKSKNVSTYFFDTAKAKVSQDQPYVIMIRKQIKETITKFGFPYMNMGELGFDTTKREYFSDDHHLSLEGRTENTLMLIKTLGLEKPPIK